MRILDLLNYKWEILRTLFIDLWVLYLFSLRLLGNTSWRVFESDLFTDFGVGGMGNVRLEGYCSWVLECEWKVRWTRKWLEGVHGKGLYKGIGMY